MLTGKGFADPVVYALPRGGVPVAVAVARALGAPLDLIMVRKIGAPDQPELALGAVVDGEHAEMTVNAEVKRLTGASDAYVRRAWQRERDEIERRRARYLRGRARVDPQGRTAIIVDDGLATGASARTAAIAIRKQGAARVVLAVPVAPVEALTSLHEVADEVICVHPARAFGSVGAFYSDFHQLTDEETVGMLREAWGEAADAQDGTRRQVTIPPLGLVGDLVVPKAARGLVIFAHGSGSSRHSVRNQMVAGRLNRRGFATLLLDLLTETEARDRRNVFDIPLLAERLVEAVLWSSGEPDLTLLRLGFFGASTGAGAALLAAAEVHGRVSAVVSRGGRPDLAGEALTRVLAPTLLIVGGADRQILTLNRGALAVMRCEKSLSVVPGATHLFEEPGTLEQAADLACDWFEHYLPATTPATMPPRADRTARDVLRAAADPLPVPVSAEFAAAFDRFAEARVVLLGEMTHGSSEFYRARAAITRRLIERHGFNLVAVEADWPDAAAIDQQVRHMKRWGAEISPFTRFPTWMWRNRDMQEFLDWLRRHNGALKPGRRMAFHGLDLYNMMAAIGAVVGYLDRVDAAAAQAARARYACLAPWSHEPAAYGRAALSEGFARCEGPVTRILLDLLRKELQYTRMDGDSFLDAAQNARLVADAETYYRAMYYGGAESWNLRDRHMFETLETILARRSGGKAVVWAHNSHIGDARFSEMGSERGEWNLGQLCREHFGRDAVLIGFGTDHGTVAAASEWDAPMEIKTVRPARPDSYEALCHNLGEPRFLLDLRPGRHDAARRILETQRLERYIGVIYRPETERWSHYTLACLPDQYDAYVWFDETRAVVPLPGRVMAGDDELYPFGV